MSDVPAPTLTAAGRAGPAAPPARAPGPADLLRRVVDVLGSFGLACVILALLTVLTLAGTLAQTHKSLFDVQEEYFESLFVLAEFGPLRLPLPGAYLLLVLLALNLVVGGLVRIRKGVATVGVLVVHAGMLALLGGGLVEYLASDRGSLRLYEGETGAVFQSGELWDLVVEEVAPDGQARAWVVPVEEIAGAGPGRLRSLRLAGLDPGLQVGDYVRNAEVVPVFAAAAGAHGAPDPHGAHGAPARPTGYRVRRLDPHPVSAEQNVPALRVLVAAGEGLQEGVLWGNQAFPWEVRTGEAALRLDLRRREFELPFAIRLEEFVKEDHPGTRLPRRFSSYVTKVEGRVETRIHITMNEPLRHEGYTLYQSGWGPQSEREPPWPYSVFSVVRNPADRVPVWACLVLAVGLLFHFLRKLVNYARAEARRSPARRAGGP